jgi:AraC-like DNA-binding protein/mannose-6-phosphate isomerase-like protein (cupin superfamily)
LNYKKPERLTNQHYMLSSSPFRIFYHTIQGHLELHWHEFYELSFVTSGEGKQVLNGVSYTMKRGDMFLLSPADFHEFFVENKSTVELYNVIFSEEMIKDGLQEVLFSGMVESVAVIHPDDILYIESEFQRLWAEEHNLNIGNQLMTKNILERILIEFIRRCGEKKGFVDQKSISFENHQINKTLTYIQHHFREQLTLEQVAKQAQLSPTYFSKCFSKATGISFQSYLQGLRLQFAKSLIKSSDLPITEISHASGFNTLTHFNRCFNQKYGKSPRMYRKKND